MWFIRPLTYISLWIFALTGLLVCVTAGRLEGLLPMAALLIHLAAAHLPAHSQ